MNGIVPFNGGLPYDYNLQELLIRRRRAPPPPRQSPHQPTSSSGVPAKGCVADAQGHITCNWDSMSTPTCPVPGPNVAMPAGCRPQRLLLLV